MYICYEPGMTKNGICQIDARTGEFLWGIDEESRHGHYGLIADIDPGQEGVELWAGDEELNKFWLFSPQGKVLSNNENTNRLAAFWNDDLQREYLDQKKKRLINYAIKYASLYFCSLLTVHCSLFTVHCSLFTSSASRFFRQC
jgi:hypothetical protein